MTKKKGEYGYRKYFKIKNGIIIGFFVFIILLLFISILFADQIKIIKIYNKPTSRIITVSGTQMTSRKCHRIKRILKGSPNEQTHLETENTRIGSSLLRKIKQNLSIYLINLLLGL